MAGLLAATTGQARQGQPRPQAGPADSGALPTLPGRPAPRLAALLVPRHAPAGAYQVTVLDVPIEKARDQVLAALAPERQQDEEPASWTVRRSEVLEAYGEGGIYDRARLARLYTGRPVNVLRGPVVHDGRVVASVTLLSPYPSPDLSHLEQGTLAILFLAEKAR